MPERNTDVGALAAGALAATLSLVIAPGAYSALSCILSVTLLAVLAGYVIGRRRSVLQRLAVATVTALAALPMVGFAAQELGVADSGWLYPAFWFILAIVVFAIDWRIASGLPIAAQDDGQSAERLPDLSAGPAGPAAESVAFARAKAIAHAVRTVLQMIVGIAIVGLLAGRAYFTVAGCPPEAVGLCSEPTLSLVGQALAYAAGIELAYMLFTPGPDEAVQPVILGIAAAVLIIVSTPDADWRALLMTPLLCGSIALMFLVERKFIRPGPNGAGGPDG